MHIPLFFLVFVAVAANPFPYAEPEVTEAPAETDLLPEPNITSGHKNPHKEPTPTFKLPCECPAAIVPINQLTPEEVSFEFSIT